MTVFKRISVAWCGLCVIYGCSGGLVAEQEDMSSGVPDAMADIVVMDDSADQGVDEPVLPREVGLELPGEQLDTLCVERAPGVEAVGVGADGSLWLSAEERGKFHVWSADMEESRVDLGALTTLVRPWSRSSAVFVAGSRLFVREGEHDVQEVRWPSTLGEIRGLCGDPRLNDSFVVADGLYQRAGDQWWEWSQDTIDFASVEALGDLSGACSGRDGRIWLMARGSLHRAHEEEVERFEPADQLAIDPDVGVVARRGSSLYFLDDTEGWVETTFAAGDVEQLAGAAGYVWVRAGGMLYQYTKGQFSRVDPGAAVQGSPTLHPDPLGGLWLLTPTQACRAQPRDVLHVRGLRPYQRTIQAAHILEVDEPVQVDVDDVSVHDGVGPVPITLDGAGWHVVRVRAGSQERRLDVLRIEPHTPNWEDDVSPIARTSCSGNSSCHGGETGSPGQPRLVTYEEWVEFANAVENRVGAVGDMPPVGQREGWSVRDATTVVSWIHGGMKERASDE